MRKTRPNVARAYSALREAYCLKLYAEKRSEIDNWEHDGRQGPSPLNEEGMPEAAITRNVKSIIAGLDTIELARFLREIARENG